MSVELATKDPQAPVVVGKPSATLLVIGAGFGRTGTLSLREALVRLGFGPCDHMLENFEHPERFSHWQEALHQKWTGQPIDWRPLLAGYQSVVDWPGAYFWRELVATHPEAKVILTVRDPERWYESTLATIYQMPARMDDSRLAPLVLRLFSLAIPRMREGFRVVNATIWNGTFRGRFTDRRYALRVFAEHSAEVQATVPPERLLVFDVKEGWAPLCEFLSVPVPEDEPFPHVNDAESFQRRIQEQFARNVLRYCGALMAGITAFLALVTLAGRALARQRRRREERRR